MPTAYEGKKPYVFVSYSHKDTDVVMQVIEAMQDSGILVWYDGGIEAGSEWPEYIASHLRNCSCMLSFISENFVQSPNCRRELNFGQDLQKDILNVYIDNVELTDGMKMQLGLNQAIFKKNYRKMADFCNAICAARIVQKCKDEVVPQPEPIDMQIVHAAVQQPLVKKEKPPIAVTKEQSPNAKQSIQHSPSALLLYAVPLVVLLQMLRIIAPNLALFTFFEYIEWIALGLACASIVITVWKKDQAFLGIWLIVFGVSFFVRLVLGAMVTSPSYVLTHPKVPMFAFGIAAALAVAFVAKRCFATKADKPAFMALSAALAALIHNVIPLTLGITFWYGSTVVSIVLSAVAAFAGVYLFKKLKCFE